MATGSRKRNQTVRRHHHQHINQIEIVKTPLTASQKCRKYCKNFIAFLFSHVGLCALVVGYAIGGAFLFQSIELPHESPMRATSLNQVNKDRNQTLEDLWNITSIHNIFDKKIFDKKIESKIREFQSKLVTAIRDEGYDGTLSSQWSFSGSFLFSLTVITTIGYGNIAPKTDEGKIATMCYAIFGIPLMLLYLTNIGGILAKSFRYLYGRFCTCKPRAPSIQERKAAAALELMRANRQSMRLNRQRSRTIGTVPERGVAYIPSSPVTAPAGTTLNQLHWGASSSVQTEASVGEISNYSTLGGVAGVRFNAARQHALARSMTDPAFGSRTNLDTDSVQGSIHNHPTPGVSGHRDNISAIFKQHHLGTAEQQRSIAAGVARVVGLDDEVVIIGHAKGQQAKEVHVPISLCLAILITYVTGGGLLFSIWEPDWGLLEGSYFCFISLSTIGFGDLVPGNAVVSGEGGNQERMVICSLYLLAGLALIAMCFNLMQEEVIHKVQNCGERIGIIKPKDDEEDEDESDDEDEEDAQVNNDEVDDAITSFDVP